MLSEEELKKQYDTIRRDIVVCEFDTFLSQAIHPDGYILPMLRVPKDLDCTQLAEARTDGATCDALENHAIARLLPRFKFVHSSSDNSVSVREGLRSPIVAFGKDYNPSDGSVAEDWHRIETFVVTVPDGQRDPWLSKDTWPLNEGITEQEEELEYWARARHITYARILLSRQQRTFVVSIQICGGSVRLFRWDWAGAVVSRPCNILTNPRLFGAFLIKLNAASRAERGWDMTAAAALPAEQKLLTDAIKGYVARVKAHVVPMLPHLLESVDTNWPAYTVHLPEEYTEIGAACTLIIQRPFMSTRTRAYYAYHVQAKRLVFYKTSWTTKCRCFDQLSEGFAYRFNQERDVRHLVHTTYASNFFPRLQDVEPERRHVNFLKFRGQTVEASRGTMVHRFDMSKIRSEGRARLDLVQELAYPLQYASSSKQLVRAVRNTLLCIQKAYADGKGLIHRDISEGNIMFNPSGDGVLNDWNCGALVESRERCRAYTYHFVSIDVLHFGGQIQSFVHDSESCLWVLVSSSRRLFALTGDVSAAEAKLRDILPATEVSHSEWTGMVSRKYDWLTASESVIQFECAPLNWLIEKLRTMFGDWYRGRFEHEVCPEMPPFEGDQMVQNCIDLCEEALAMDPWPVADAHHHRLDLETAVPGTPAIEPVFGDASWLTDRRDGKLVYYQVRPRYDEHEQRDNYVPLFFLPRHLKRLALEKTAKVDAEAPEQPMLEVKQRLTPLSDTISANQEPMQSFVFGASRPMKGIPRRRKGMRKMPASSPES